MFQQVMSTPPMGGGAEIYSEGLGLLFLLGTGVSRGSGEEVKALWLFPSYWLRGGQAAVLPHLPPLLLSENLGITG